MKIDFDFPDLERFVTDLSTMGNRLDVAMAAVITKGAVSVKNEARAIFADLQKLSVMKGYLPHYARSITYDVSGVVDHVVNAEIGPDSDMIQGRFGLGIEMGSIHHAPMPHLGPALDMQEEPTANFMGDIAEAAFDL